MSKKITFDIILNATGKGLASTFSKGGRAIGAFNKQVSGGNQLLSSMTKGVVALAGAWTAFDAIRSGAVIMEQASQAGFNLQSSLQAANREFDVGSADDWNGAIERLSGTLEIYSKASLKNAISRTIDMTKRLGMSQPQMEQIIALTADLSAGKTDLENGVERVTAALRGEAEASEYLGLTLNENYVKAWHNANNATGQAWKDLTDLEKAQVRYNVFLEQALPNQGRAAESLSTLGGAIASVKKEIHDSLAEHKDLVAALNDLAAVARDNREELGNLVGSMATATAKALEWTLQNKDLLVTLGKGGGLLLALTLVGKALGSVASITKGVNAAFFELTGSSILPWLAKLHTALIALVTANPILAIATAAAFLAVQLGRNVNGLRAMLQAWSALAQAQKEQAENSAFLSDKITAGLAKATASTGIQIDSMEQFNKLARDGVIIFDQQAQQWVKVSTAAEQSAAKQTQVQGDALEKMRQQYAKYVEEIKQFQDQIAGRERSLAEELRSMTRSVMDAGRAWQDQKAEAEEYEAAARRAAEAGDFSQAIELADKAKTKFKALNQEVKAGDQVMVSQQQALETAMGGVERSGQLAIDVLKEQETAARNAAEALTRDSGFQDLSTGIEDFDRIWATSWQHMQEVSGAAFAATEGQIVSFARQLDEATKNRQVEVDAKLTPAAKRILSAFDDLPGVTVNVPGYATGTYLPGYGGGDRRPAMLEDGEVVLKKETVRAVGPDWLLHLNALGSRAAGMIRARVGGLINNARLQTVAPLRMQNGGLVSGGGQETINLNLLLPGASRPAQVQASRATTRQIIADLERSRRLSS